MCILALIECVPIIIRIIKIIVIIRRIIRKYNNQVTKTTKTKQNKTKQNELYYAKLNEMNTI